MAKKTFKARIFEILDSTPVAIPLRFKRPPTKLEEIQAAVRSQMSILADAQGYETFEEANDFEMDEAEPSSLWEVPDNHEHFVEEVIRSRKPQEPSLGHGSPSGDPPKPKRGKPVSEARSEAEDPPEEG